MKADFVGLGYCSNDHLAVLPFIPMDTKVQMIKHAILGGGPSANSTAGAAALGLQRVRQLPQRRVGAALLVGAAVDEQDFHTLNLSF